MGKRIIAMLLAVAMCTELLAGCGTAVSITIGGDTGAAVEKTGVASAVSDEKETKDTPEVVLQDQGSYRVSDQTERLYCVTDETGKGAVFGWLKEAADASFLSPGKSIEGAEITLLGADMQPMKDKNGKERKIQSSVGGSFWFEIGDTAESFQEKYYLSIQADGYYPIAAYEVEYIDLEKFKEQFLDDWIKTADALSQLLKEQGAEGLYGIGEENAEDPETFAKEYILGELQANEPEVQKGLEQLANVDPEHFWIMVKDGATTDFGEMAETWFKGRSDRFQAHVLYAMSFLAGPPAGSGYSEYYDYGAVEKLREEALALWPEGAFWTDLEYMKEFMAVADFLVEQLMIDMGIQAAARSWGGLWGMASGVVISVGKSALSLAAKLRRYAFVTVRPADMALDMAGVGRVFLRAADEANEGRAAVVMTSGAADKVQDTVKLIQETKYGDEILSEALGKAELETMPLSKVKDAFKGAVKKQQDKITRALKEKRAALRAYDAALDYKPSTYGVTVPDNIIGQIYTSRETPATIMAQGGMRDPYEIYVVPKIVSMEEAEKIIHESILGHEIGHLLVGSSAPAVTRALASKVSVYSASEAAGKSGALGGSIWWEDPKIFETIERALLDDAEAFYRNAELLELYTRVQYSYVLTKMSGPMGEMLYFPETPTGKYITHSMVAELFDVQTDVVTRYLPSYLNLQTARGVLTTGQVDEILKHQKEIANLLLLEGSGKCYRVLSEYKANGTYAEIMKRFGTKPVNMTVEYMDETGKLTKAGEELEKILGARGDESLAHSKVMDQIVQRVKERAILQAEIAELELQAKKLNTIRTSITAWGNKFTEWELQAVKSLLSSLKNGLNLYLAIGLRATLFWAYADKVEAYDDYVYMQPMSEDYAGLSGVVIDKESNLPVSGAMVELYRTGDTVKVGGHRGQQIGEPVWSRQENGTFSFTGLEPGNYCLYVSKEGYKRFESGFSLEEGEGNPRKVVLEPLKESENPERVESTPSPDVTASPKASPSPTATVTPQPTPSVTPMPTVKPKPTATPGVTPSPSTTPSTTPTVNSTVSPMVSPGV